MTRRFYFDVWDRDDVNGTALGELTQAYNRSFVRLDQAVGSGEFTVNRHDSQYLAGWCQQDNLVRVRLEAGGPFDYDDERYVHAFWIEEGDDEVVSTDEEGGEEIHRGGRSEVAILRRALINYQADYSVPGDDDLIYWSRALIDGQVHLLSRNSGEVMRVFLRNATARSPDPLAPSSHDFNAIRDSAGVDWTDAGVDYHFDVGQDLLAALEVLGGSDMFWRMTPDLVLHAYDSQQGTDLSATVRLEAATNIRESAQRQVHARNSMSRALVQGTKTAGGLTFRWVTDGTVEAALGGRREGFVEYETTPTPARLDRAGERAIRSRFYQYEGPTTIGIEEREGDPIAFEDFNPGDLVTVHIPGVWEEHPSPVHGVSMSEDAAGEALTTIIMGEVPFDGGTGSPVPDQPGGCGSCPPPPPHVPGTQPGTPAAPPDATCVACNTVTVDAERNGFWECPAGTTVPGQVYTWRVTNTGHDALALTENFEVTAGGTTDLWTNPGGSPGVMPTQVGTLVASDSSGFGFHGHANYAPGVVGTDECWTVEFWLGEVDPDGSPDVPIPPGTGQWVTGETPAVSIGASTTTLTVDWPYAPGSPQVRVDNILISPAAYTETTPGSGVITLSWAKDADEVVTVSYQAAT